MKATDDEGYGYLWWTGRSGVRRRTVDWVGALGRGGQSIRIVPALDLVVVVTAGYYQDYSPQAFKVQYGVFREVLQATSFPAWARAHRGKRSARWAPVRHLIELPLSDCAAIDALTSAIP